MIEYRRLKGSNTWHNSKKCATWPIDYFDKHAGKPEEGKVCAECLKKENNKEPSMQGRGF